MKIDSNFISDVKSKLDIVDVIGAYINLQKPASIIREYARSIKTVIPR